MGFDTRTLRFKVGTYLAVTLTAALVLFAVLAVRHERANLLEEAAAHVNQLSDIAVRSTRFAMLNNRPDYVHNVIQDIARHDKIDRVRIFNKDGVIIDSTVAQEIGLKVDSRAEGCAGCHQNGKPLKQVPSSDRARLFETTDGRRMLASMEVIRNEPSCYTAACHAHAPDQSVLGVLDIVYPLEDIEARLRTSGAAIGAVSLALVVAASLAAILFVHRLELREWGRTLEQKVAERTRALRLAEAEAVRGEKLASVGLLAAGIAHELNNPLTGVLTFSTLLRRKFAAGSQEAEDLDLVIGETKRCAAIIRRLLDFAREKAPEKKFADLNRLIEDTVRIVERPANLTDIAIGLELDRALPPVWVDADLFRQVIMNMLVNAQHAIEAKGTITIRTRVRPGTRMAEISIVDTGCGIPEKNLARIFDPFFTTKGVGKGTGLGLSVSHGIVEAHGGTIEVESREGEGTTFRVLLPLEPAAAAAATPAEGLAA